MHEMLSVIPLQLESKGIIHSGGRDVLAGMGVEFTIMNGAFDIKSSSVTGFYTFTAIIRVFGYKKC